MTASSLQSRDVYDEPLNSYEYVESIVFDLAGPIAPGMRVLDVGCGGGYLVGRFLEHGCEVVGIDPNTERLELARARYPDGRFEQLDANDQILEQLGGDPFDLVVSTEVLEHLYAPQLFATGAYRALRPGGHVVVTTPYHGYAKNLVIAGLGKADSHYQPLYTGGHIKFFSRRTLTQLLGGAGFRDLEFRGAGRVPGLWKSMVMRGTRR